MRANNVIDSEYDSNEIYRKLLKCLYDKRFIDKCKKTPNLYEINEYLFRKLKYQTILSQ